MVRSGAPTTFREGQHRRDRNGKFANGGIGTNLTKYRSKKSGKTIRKALNTARRKKFPTLGSAVEVDQRQVRAARNTKAVSALNKKGYVLPPGTAKKARQLKKGESLRLADGRVLRRSRNNTYRVLAK